MALPAELNEYPFITLAKQAEVPVTPDPGLGRAFMKSDGLPYFLNDDGIEMLLFQDLDISAAGLYRGEWATDTLAYVEDFSGGSVPAIFTDAEVGAGLAPAATTVAASGVGGSSVGAGYTGAVRIGTPQINYGNSSTLTLDLYKTGVENITRVKFWMGHADQNNVGYKRSASMKNGVNQVARDGTFGWVQDQLPVTEADSIGWTEYGNVGVSSTVTAYLFVTGIEIYATPAPYMLGQYVVYAGRLWRSLADHNVGVPGTSGWAAVPMMGVAVNAQTGAAYTCALTDAGCLVTASNAAANAVTVPPNSAVAFPIGTRIEVANLGAGACTVTAGAGVTLTTEAGFSLVLAQGQAIRLTKLATNTWLATRG